MERLDLAVSRIYEMPRAFAHECITRGLVRVNGSVCLKPGQKVPDDAAIVYTGEPKKYVSRGGYKLEHGLTSFGVSLRGLVCLDAGASTGGFTDCMLQMGASRVYAVDSGTDQLHESLRYHTRVVSFENVNIKDITTDMIPLCDFAAADLSFISITKAAPSIKQFVKPGGHMIFLIKPQFEAGREHLNKKGICKDPKIRKKVVETVLNNLLGLGLTCVSICSSPITGGDGNIEYIAHLRHKGDTKGDLLHESRHIPQL